MPWNYHMSFQSFIYQALDKYEPEIATKLHQYPHAPPFSFSEFIQTGPFQATDDGLMCESGYWIVTSDDKRIIDAVANHAQHDSKLTLGHTTIPVTGVDIEKIQGKEKERYKSTSPIYVSQRGEDGEVEDLFPEDGMWYSRLKDSVRDRIRHERTLPDDFQFIIDEVHWSKKKRLRSGDGWRSCSRLELTIRSDLETSEFIQQQGLGEKTGMGFGNLMPTNEIPEEWR
ncbi:CRISPR-associated endoribonuclease Cas6 [Halorutilales archaeon Cl-col2-1]